MVGRRGRRSSEHDRVVARRLELLGAELAAARTLPPQLPDEPTHTRIRPVPGSRSEEQAAIDAAPEPAPEPGTGILVAGRHAARHRLVAGLGAAQLVVVALLVLAGAGGVLWWLSGGPEPEAVPPPRAAGDLVAVPTTAGGARAPGPSPVSGGTVTVDVAGDVRRPGIAVLDAGSRVVDALAAAGGARAGVYLTCLNLARVLVDGEQILVGVDPPSGVAGTLTGAPSPVAALVDINTADQVTLESLPDVGPVTAQAILAWRTEHGGFTSVDQLLDVDGIGEATLAKLAPYVTL